MKPGAVIVDLAAETGGNCELTRAGQDRRTQRRDHPRAGQHSQPAAGARHRDVRQEPATTSSRPSIKDGELTLDWNDEVIARAAC
ncbi:MAG: hypothetical protein MZV65_28405 [Chromatiales bacterium]|nr:hypothetical protein [Chromatiales bacterium]